MSKRKDAPAPTEDTETVVEKKALSNSCKNDAVFGKIQDDVREMSALFVEVSRYIHFSLMKRRRDGNFEALKFQAFYYHLMCKKKAQYVLDAEYEVRAEKVYRTLSYLFQSSSTEVPDDNFLQSLKEKLAWNGEKLDKIQNKKLFWSCIPLFYNIQRYNEAHNIKNFSLIPIPKHGSHHIQYDSFALYQMLCGLKLYKGAWGTFERSVEWQKYFAVPEISNKKFNFSLQTDSVAVSFSMKKARPAQLNTTVKKRKYQKCESDCSGNLAKIRSTAYDNKLGLDPGLRFIYGGVKNGQPIKLKSATYHNMSGFHARSSKLKKYKQGFTEDSQVTPHSANFTQYTTYQLSIFERKQSDEIEKVYLRAEDSKLYR